MMLEFLRTYRNAVSLDDPKYASCFPPNKQKADFLLFENLVICEVKDICTIDMPAQVERVKKKPDLSSYDVARDVSRSIIAYLHDAARQIHDTSEVLDLPDALGLAIMENHISETMSSAVLFAVADSEMRRAIPAIDGVLCLDLVNAFTRCDGDSIRLAQLVCRPGKRSEKLSRFVGDRLMVDFFKHTNIPLRSGHTVEKLEQVWVTDQYGKFQNYKAKVDLAAPVPRIGIRQSILRFVAKWAILFGLGWILLVWLIRRLHF
jgi:hypothetical protein